MSRSPSQAPKRPILEAQMHVRSSVWPRVHRLRGATTVLQKGYAHVIITCDRRDRCDERRQPRPAGSIPGSTSASAGSAPASSTSSSWSIRSSCSGTTAFWRRAARWVWQNYVDFFKNANLRRSLANTLTHRRRGDAPRPRPRVSRRLLPGPPPDLGGGPAADFLAHPAVRRPVRGLRLHADAAAERLRELACCSGWA